MIQPVRPARAPSSCIHYAVIIEAGRELAHETYENAYFVEWCLTHVFDTERANIRFLVSSTEYLPSYIDYDDVATHENVRYYISDWLAKQNGSLFIYITGHGGGFSISSGQLCGGRLDNSGDEGTEHGCYGVDECIKLEADNSKYWDDEFHEDVLNVSYASWLTMLIQTCRPLNGTEEPSCFCGGFIDDLSDIRYRTIITSANETGVSWVSSTETAPISPFTYYYMSAFSDYKIIYAGASTRFDETQPLNWEYKSWRGAFEYALLHDPYYPDGECPWFDDDGDGLPTYANDMEVLDFPVDGQDLMRWLKCDVNCDGKVDMKDIGIVCQAFGSTPWHERWNRQADVHPYEDWKVDMKDLGEVGRHYGETT